LEGVYKSDADLKLAYQPALAFFCVFRQIHEEAASTFYSNNVFMICRHLVPYDDEDILGIHDINGTYIFHAGVPWLSNLGCRNRELLRKLDLDIGGICPPHCYDKHGVWLNLHLEDDTNGLVEIGMLLRMIRGRESLGRMLPKLDITFVRASIVPIWCLLGPSVFHAPAALGPISAPIDTSCDLVALNALWRGLLRDDIGINKYYALIGSIGLQRDSSGGFIAYHTSGNGSWHLGNGEAG
jgi:hypothetical protein